MKRITGLLSLTTVIAATLISCGTGKDKKNAADSTARATTETGVAVTANKPVPGTPIQYDSSKRYVFLTWDDAPQPPGTMICRDIFRKNGVKATFFAVGMHQYDHARKAMVDDIRNSYPEFLLANHSHSHAFNNKYHLFYSLPDSAVKDFIKAEKEMQIPVKIIRLPGNPSWAANGDVRGPKSTLPVCRKLDELGYKVIGWDVEWGFKGGSTPIQGAEQMAQIVNEKFDSYTSNEPNTIVILAHDRMFAKPQYADSLNKFINILKQDPRNVFETLDHYPMVQRKK